MNETLSRELRPYVEPKVTTLGSVEELTAHGSILLSDNPTHRTLIL